jgi:hypothetical protein
MMTSEFDALLDAVVQSPEFANQSIEAAYLQINQDLLIQSAVFFSISFDHSGDVVSDWNLPFNQLLQSAGRGPDLGAGSIRLVTASQCTTPWLQSFLFDPAKSVYGELAQSVKVNKLGILESDSAFSDTKSVPILQRGIQSTGPEVDADIPTLSPAEIPLAVPILTPSHTSSDAEPLVEGNSQAFAAMKQALTIKLNRLQKDFDQLQEKMQSSLSTMKQQAKVQLEQVVHEAKQDELRKDQQIQSLKQQLQHEQTRYTDLKDQQIEQVAGYQVEREDMLDQLADGQILEAKKIDALKAAFSKEIDARIEAETTQLNEQLAIREVELFYREEQMGVLADEAKQLREEKQLLLTDSGKQVLKQLEDNGVTFVVYHVGVGHITLALDDVGRYLDQRNAYLAERCGITEALFLQWDEHFNHPVCSHMDDEGNRCTAQLIRVEWAASFQDGLSNRCSDHQQ